MKKIKNKLEDFIERYTGIIFFILALATFGMFIIVFMQVLFRYVLYLPLFWIEETARYLLIFIAMMGGTLAFKDDIHPKVAILYNRLKYFKRIKWELFLRVFMIIFLMILIFSGWSWAKDNSCFRTGGLGISYYWPLMAIPIGAVAMLVILLADSLNILMNKKSYLIKKNDRNKSLL
jgi:C4-dicarboxylate transporter DctQ subunit